MYPDPLTNRRYITLLIGIFYTLLYCALAAFSWEEWSRADKLVSIAQAVGAFVILQQLIERFEGLYNACEQWLADGYDQEAPVEPLGSSQRPAETCTLGDLPCTEAYPYTGLTKRLEL